MGYKWDYYIIYIYVYIYVHNIYIYIYMYIYIYIYEIWGVSDNGRSAQNGHDN